MRRPSTLVLLVFAFVGGNMLMGISSNARSAKSSTGTFSKQQFFLCFFPLAILFIRILFFSIFLVGLESGVIVTSLQLEQLSHLGLTI